MTRYLEHWTWTATVSATSQGKPGISVDNVA